jgi:hypothetical protein
MTNDVDRTPVEPSSIPEELNLEVMQDDLTEQAPEVEAVRSQLEGVTDRDTGLGRTLHRLIDSAAPGLAPTGGDIDVDQYQAKVSGEEAIGGTAPTPDQSVVEDLAVSAGIPVADTHPLHVSDMLEHRNSHRWELEPESAEDYEEHQE